MYGVMSSVKCRKPMALSDSVTYISIKDVMLSRESERGSANKQVISP